MPFIRGRISQHLNFYRIHLLLFTAIPLISSAIFFASNGRFKIKYSDCLFVCYSAVTGTGLTTIDLSSLTAWQQVILALLQLTGNQVFVSWAVVFVRRWYYRKYLHDQYRSELRNVFMQRRLPAMAQHSPSFAQIRSTLMEQRADQGVVHNHIEREVRHRSTSTKLRPEMVRRIDVAPRRINPTGTLDMAAETTETRPHSVRHTRDRNNDMMPRTQTRVTISEQPAPVRTEGGFGGFPGPQEIGSRLFRKLFPRFYRGLHRTFTMPRTRTLVPHDSIDIGHTAGPLTQVPYFSFKATVGRNSVFTNLTEEQMDELGGVEYRALNTLLWVTPLYYFGLLAIGVVIVAPYMALPRWKSNFVPPQQHRKISSVWFSIFQVVGAWANTGMSLVDQNLFPFQTAYPMIFVLISLVMAGNTAFPIFFRFTIWLLRKAFTTRTSTGESLLFLLHHPRRCFINLFPARQTWLLLVIVVTFTLVTLVGDIVLNLGNPVTDAIPVGTRILDAFLQSAATRSAGFQPFPLSSQFPAALVLYIITMYIAIYPIALSVRSTNVYEEQSLGIYPSETLDTYQELNTPENRIAIWGKYLMRHTRRQLSFDMWWLALSLWLISIIERKGLTDPSKQSWLNLFALIFEVVSAYGTVGLSLGVPGQNYSLSGALHPLSKLIICVVMLRGRHRGLPVALDRAVMLPREFRRRTEGEDNESIEQPPSPQPSNAAVSASGEPSDVVTASDEHFDEKHPEQEAIESQGSSSGSNVEAPVARDVEHSSLR